MSDALISASPAVGTPQLLDADLVTTGAGAVLRERVRIGGALGADLAAIAKFPNPDWTLGGLQVALHGMIAGDTTFGATEYGLPMFAKRHDANTSLATVDGRFVPMQLSALGNLKVAILEGGGQQYAEDAAHVSGDLGMMALAVRRDTPAAFGADGDYTPLSTDVLNRLWVRNAWLTPNGDTMVDDTAGIDALQVTLMTMVQAIGSVAHDSPDTQPPVKIGGYASAALRAVVTEADRVDASFDLQGQQRVLPTSARRWSALGTYSTAIAGASSAPTLKNLANAAQKIGNAIDLTAAGSRQLYVDLDLLCRFQSAPVAGGYCEVYFVPAVDGTNYGDGDDSVAPPLTYLVAQFPVRAVTTAQRVAYPRLVLPATLFKPLLINKSGVAMTNTDNENVLSYRAYTPSDVN